MGRHTLAGIGSLVSEASARQSFAFTNFRIGEIRGWRRAFNQANWVNEKHSWCFGPDATAALAMVRADSDYVSTVALMDVEDEGLSSFYEREAGYDIQETEFCERAADGTIQVTGTALLCTACKDDAAADALWAPGGAMERHCPGSEYVARWMGSSLRPLWPAPSARLLPSSGYLVLCAEAHAQAGLLEHFLDSTLLNDRITTLRGYCSDARLFAAHARAEDVRAMRRLMAGTKRSDDDV